MSTCHVVMLPPSLRWTGEQLDLLDQRRLPHEVAILPLRHWRDVAEAIATMSVRGAPAIGVAAAWGVVMAARAGDDLEEAIAVLRASRPTAVNLAWALDRMRSSQAARSPVDARALQALAEDIEAEDRRLTQRLVQHGVGLLPADCRVLHHCHTGAIATAGVGTALGVITEAHQQGLLRHAWLDETRPRLQGAGLSAWELGRLGVPCTVIVDGASGLLMRRGEVDAVLVATGRVPSSKDLNLEALGVETNRGFVPIDDRMRVLANGQPVDHHWAVGDVTGKLMLAHTAAAQGTVAIDNILGHNREIDYRSIPAATFTHPEISSVGLSEADAKQEAADQGFELGVVRSYFKANSKALAELESDGLMKLLFNKVTGEVLGAHIYGLHAADLIQEVSNAVARRQSVRQLATEVHTHPTLSEVVEAAYKQAAAALPAAA